MKVCVDTSILLDVLKDEFRIFQEKLYLALERKELLLAPSVVFSELMPQFKGNAKLLGEFLEEHNIAVKPLGMDAATAAAGAWMKYLRRKTKEACPQCGQKLNLKEHFLADFYIGGFAATNCDTILTRDRGIYKKYFPDLVGYEGCLNSA